MKIKAVLFDLDCTLLDRDESVRRFAARQHGRLLQWFGHVPQEEFVRRFIELDSRGYVWKDRVYRQMTLEYGVKELTCEALVEDYVSEFKHSCVPFPYLNEMLEELRSRGLKLGLVTNGPQTLQWSSIEALGIQDYFSAILISEAEGIQKPDPDIFHRALGRLGVSAEESVYVGDHPENDVQASQKAGMRAVWKKDRWRDEAAVTTPFKIDCLSELPALIEKWQNRLD